MCSPQQVLVLNSPMQAIELIGRVLLEPGDKVWLEDPGHASLVSLFQVLRAQVVGVPLDARGLDVAAGRAPAPDAAAVYLHPLTQFPLGVRTDSARRAELLQWADESAAPGSSRATSTTRSRTTARRRCRSRRWTAPTACC